MRSPAAREASSRLFVGLDVGSSSIRAIGFDERGVRRAFADCRTPLRYDRREAATIHPDELWRAVADVLRRIVGAGPVQAVGVCGQLGMLGIAASGKATTPIVLWSDSRAGAEAAELAERLGAQAYTVAHRQVTGEVMAAKIRWFSVHHPATVSRTRLWLSLKDYIVARLTGEYVTDATHASYSLLFDVSERTWSRALVEAAGVAPDTLPPVADATALAGLVSSSAARATGLFRGTPVAVGSPDGTAGAVGAGAVAPGTTVDVAGTTDVVFRTTSVVAGMDPRLVANAYALPGLWAVGGPTGMTGGAVLWLAQLLGYPGAAELREGLAGQARAAGSDSAGLVFRTELTGARFPGWTAGTRGVIAGIRPDHQAAHLLRAAEEGAAFLVGDGLDAVEESTGRIDRVVVVGGPSVRDETLQLRADAWRRTVVTVREREASALGAAMLAGLAANVWSSPSEAAFSMVHPDATFRPSKVASARLALIHALWIETRNASDSPT